MSKIIKAPLNDQVNIIKEKFKELASGKVKDLVKANENSHISSYTFSSENKSLTYYYIDFNSLCLQITKLSQPQKRSIISAWHILRKMLERATGK